MPSSYTALIVAIVMLIVGAAVCGIIYGFAHKLVTSFGEETANATLPILQQIWQYAPLIFYIAIAIIIISLIVTIVYMLRGGGGR